MLDTPVTVDLLLDALDAAITAREGYRGCYVQALELIDRADTARLQYAHALPRLVRSPRRRCASRPAGPATRAYARLAKASLAAADNRYHDLQDGSGAGLPRFMACRSQRNSCLLWCKRCCGQPGRGPGAGHPGNWMDPSDHREDASTLPHHWLWPGGSRSASSGSSRAIRVSASRRSRVPSRRRSPRARSGRTAGAPRWATC